MLRASIETEGGEADLRGITDGAAATESAIPGAAELVAFAEAALASDAGATAKARDALRETLGSASVVDAAGVIGNFERMVRIADGTGIPLDTPVSVATESIRSEIGIDGFESASRTKPVAGWQRTIGRIAQPVLRAGLRLRGRSSGHGR